MRIRILSGVFLGLLAAAPVAATVIIHAKQITGFTELQIGLGSNRAKALETLRVNGFVTEPACLSSQKANCWYIVQCPNAGAWYAIADSKPPGQSVGAACGFTSKQAAINAAVAQCQAKGVRCQANNWGFDNGSDHRLGGNRTNGIYAPKARGGTTALNTDPNYYQRFTHSAAPKRKPSPKPSADPFDDSAFEACLAQTSHRWEACVDRCFSLSHSQQISCSEGCDQQHNVDNCSRY
ncbi:hypothetical protein [uncultured Ferrimonas sp.]|uniref:hypothetical protein n=1 Tax=uncultured Ferrimonas sp. TaxID=432640 RepID=UPI00261CC1DD|nr:hypothetical protein [uncultured Ferrimonas sp.]